MISGCGDDLTNENTLEKSSFGNEDAVKNESIVKWEVVGLRPGDRKIAAIKAIRSVTGLGLKDAKDMAEEMPVTIVTGITKNEADLAVKELNDAGVEVELRKLEK
jgi:large subunit ribosomal protein L7/L12